MSLKLHTVDQAAEILSLHPQQVRELIWAKELSWVNVGQGKKRPRIRVRESELERFIKTRTSGSRARPSVRAAA